MNIMKRFSFCYAHRVWNQTLTNSALCRCRFCHGHLGKVELVLTAPELTRGMIIDFNELKPIKQFIDDFIDHKTLIDIADPLLPHYLNMLNCTMGDVVCHGLYYKIATPSLPQELEEFAQSLVIIPYVPTSEHLSNWLALIVMKQLEKWTEERDVRLVSLKWWESETSYAEWCAE